MNDQHGFKVGEVVYLDPKCLPELIVITKEEAEEIAAKSSNKQFVITEIKRSK